MAEKKFVCSYDGCDKTFNRRDYLERHAANHLQVKPYVCHDCERQFSRKDLYDNHLNTRFHARRVNKEGGLFDNTHSPEMELEPPALLPAQLEGAATPASMVAGASSTGELRAPSEDSGFYSNSGPIQFGLEVAPNVPGTDIHSSLLGASIGSDFDTSNSIYYGGMPGFESERWEYYRPFKRLPQIAQYGNSASGSKRRTFPAANGTSVSEGGSESADTNSNSSELTTTNGTLDTELASHNSSSLSSTPNQAAPAPAAYKMWLIDRFQSEKDSDVKSLREPVTADTDFDRKYEWFFDNNFTTANDKFGYNKMYSLSVRTFKERALRFQAVNWPGQAPNRSIPKVSEERAQLLRQVLAAGTSQALKSCSQIDQYIDISWKKANVVTCIVHRPTFNPNTAHPALVAALVLIGMALSSDQKVNALAKAATPNVSLYVYESLEQPDGPMSARYSLAYVGHFLAFCLLLKYEPLILGKDLYNCSLIRASSCRRSADKFLSKLIASVGQLGLVPKDENLFRCTRKPVWATISQEGYVFHQGADQENQWREWAAYEMCKRTVHFAVYCDTVISMCDSGQNNSAISLFNLDIHMVCPESVWQAQDPDEFFYIFGPSTILSNLPFLGLIKSLVRFPRVLASVPLRSMRPGNEDERTPLSLMALRMTAHGLMNIVSRLSGVFSKGDSVVHAVLNSSISDAGMPLSPFFDVGVQARLYRGLDIWFQHFEVSYGKVTERLFQISDAIGLRITDEMMADIDDEQDDRSIPQYALYLVLYHYSSFIIVHEDLPIVLQVTTNLAKWLQPAKEPVVDQKKLLDFLYMPLYVQWVQSDEAKAMISTAAMYLVWIDAASGQVDTKSWNHLFLSAVIYTSVLVVWLNDLVLHFNKSNGDMSTYSAGTVNSQNYEFLEQVVRYLQLISNNPDAMSNSNESSPPILSVLLAGACFLYVRPYTEELYGRLEQLICVLDPSMTPDRIRLILEGANEVFRTRHNTVIHNHNKPSEVKKVKQEAIELN